MPSTAKQSRTRGPGAPQVTLSCLILLAVYLGLSTPVRAVDVHDSPKLKAFVDDMAAKHGFSVSELDQLFGQVELQPQIIDAINRPKESLPWYQYEKIFLTPEMISTGVDFWNANASALAKAQARYGVDPQIVVAILGVETHYGQNIGRFRILDALTTLMLGYPQRSGYFRGELEQYLLLAQELHVDPLSIKGSYAGAIGAPQFMPSSYRRYAVDFDGDHRRDILHSSFDAIGSVANFLAEHGWLQEGSVCDGAARDERMYIWRDAGDSKPKPAIGGAGKYVVARLQTVNAADLATPVSLEDRNGPALRLCYHNFFVITSYNSSTRYAMVIYNLARLISRQYLEEGGA
ncbi:MAG: lytic murein transglycosylase B [Acidiferrobacterales bacterium]